VSKDWYRDIVDFHKEVMKGNFPTSPHITPKRYKDLRRRLVNEETLEFFNALNGDDLVGIADSISDCIVVLLGTAVTYGIDIRPIWDEVHRTNMLKKGGKLRDDGKVLKPEGWKPPDILSILRSQGANL